MYIETWLGFIGFTEIKSVIMEPTLSDPETIVKAKNKASDEVIKIAMNF